MSTSTPPEDPTAMPRTPDGGRRAGDRETEHKDTVGAEASPVRTWLRLLFWLAVVAVVALSLLPSQRLPGFTATVWDKAQHAGGFALLALLGLRAYASPRKGTWPVLAGLMALGIAIELAQSATGWRHGDARDAMADAVGLALGWLLVRVWPNAQAGNTLDVMHLSLIHI
jgi:VanZ family protein